MWGEFWGDLTWGGMSAHPVPITGPIGVALLLLIAIAFASRFLMSRRAGLSTASWLGLAVLVAIPLIAIAGSVTPPNVFSNGQVADADAVNQNFDAVAGAVNDNDSRLSQIESVTPPTSTSCSVGSFVTGFDISGSPVCGVAAGDISSVLASGGLTGGGSSGAVALSIASGGVTSARLGTASVTNTKLGSSSVSSSKLGTSSVTNAKIGSSAVTNSKLATGSVTPSKMTIPNVSFDAGVPIQISGGSDVTLTSGGYFMLGTTSSYNVAMDNNEIQARLNSQSAELRLNWDGGQVRSRHVRITAPSGLATQDTALQVTGIRDATLAGGGQLMLGNYTASNLVLDDNEIQARNNGAASELRLNYDGGNVRFGGEAYVPALHITGGADLAEHFDVAEGQYGEIEPGDVLCINVDRPGQLRRCDSALDRTVVGVVSGAGGVRPGMLLGQAGTVGHGDYPVALTGRVYVHADARHGAIRPGDALTTSATPGHAMRADDPSRATGALLGKAMTGLPDGRGLVLVLVALQ